MTLFQFRTHIGFPLSHFKNLGCVSGRLAKHLAWELEHTYHSGDLFEVDVRVSAREDHAGLSFDLCLFGYSVHFQIYDTRHWNYGTNSWEVTAQ